MINLVIVLAFVNWSISKKESILNNGQLVLFELAPVDPRSIMQGDYMELRYRMSDTVKVESLPKKGFIALKVNENSLPISSRIMSNLPNEPTSETYLKYQVKNGRLTFGAESYLFQEGKGSKFDKAKFGGLIIDKDGRSILKGLYDENLQEL